MAFSTNIEITDKRLKKKNTLGLILTIIDMLFHVSLADKILINRINPLYQDQEVEGTVLIWKVKE